MKRKGIHYAKVKSSPRLRRVLEYLSRDDFWHSTRDIMSGANVCAVNTCITELRRNKYEIEFKWRYGIPMYRRVK